ncbi:MAG: hypothetical protein HFI26_08515 [Lachnospiraceae bacterium]|jgi:hypothetical protein|nr:hypothetical protein [Lachnospiraceae bacterium]
MEKLKRIQIGDKRYPVKIDLNVLEAIQDSYGTIGKFERDLLGLKYKTDDNGERRLYKTEPSIKAIKTVLPEMINEGLSIEAEETGKSFEPVSAEFVNRECTVPYDILAEMIHEEFKRCFSTKK